MPLPDDLPRLLTLQRPPGAIKLDYDDFVVEELALYPADGSGTHTYFWLEKRGLSTLQAVRDVARALGVRPRDIGYAGLKDAKAVTRQWLSVEHIEPARLEALSIPRISVLDTTRHRNKLKLGHLRGNRFAIRIRGTDPSRLAELQDALAFLRTAGVPNYFGQQRFGGRGDSWKIGQAIIHDQLEDATDFLLGRPNEHDRGDVLRARELYEAGDYEQAAKRWPGMFRDEKRVLRSLQQSGRKRRAFRAVDRATRSLFISAYQSWLFNRVVGDRLTAGTLGQLLPGDLAWVHRNGAVFHVEDAGVEQPRAQAFEISATGPLFGYRMTEASGVPGALESQLLASEGLTTESFRTGSARVKGARRPLRFPIGDDATIALGADDRGPYLLLCFELPRGCYATSLLRELVDDVTSGTFEHEVTEDPRNR